MSFVSDPTIAIVTGVSHQKGIGAAICKELAKCGIDIFFTYWEAEEGWLDYFSKEIKNRNVRCFGIEIDLSKKDSPDFLMDVVTNKMGVPTILVNNAAYSTRDGYQKLNADILDKHYAVNVRATCLLSALFVQQIKEVQLKFGRIINITSGQAQGPMVGELSYVASKGAISAFTLSLSAEVAPLGITVNAVNPGPTDTGWMTSEQKEEMLLKFRLGRLGQPADAAHLVSFLASKNAGWITGQVINSEGGFLRQ
ncbi:SDR family oxidoreductase [Shimazuella kribbensis]|uniref:SDR family oxidoreductase n=1 Tax=Shimazuella kribbensis TaxID=139808 RepID=UPI0004227CEF|nr:SDR family oxidoreductase [Shimazuella kribbensis]